MACFIRYLLKPYCGNYAADECRTETPEKACNARWLLQHFPFSEEERNIMGYQPLPRRGFPAPEVLFPFNSREKVEEFNEFQP